MWVIWIKNHVWQKCGPNSWLDLYSWQKWKYHATFETKEEAEKISISTTTQLNPDYDGPGGQYCIEAIYRPVGSNPNWEECWEE